MTAGLAPRARVADGAASFGAGARFVVLRPRSWRLAIVPVLVAAALVTALGALGVWGAFRVADDLAHHLGATWEGPFAVVLRLLLALVAVVAAALVGLSLAQPLSGPALEALARELEGELGLPARPEGAFWPSLLRGLRVTFTALLAGVPVLAVLALVDLVVPVAMVVTVPLKALVTALMVSWDLLDYPFSLRQMGVRARLGWMRANLRAVVTFGLLSALGLIVPGLGLLVLPIGVAGATHLVARREP